MARNLLITILNGAKEKLTKSADASSAPVKVEPSYKVRPRLPIMAELDGRELMEKAREGLTQKTVQVNRGGKTFSQKVWVRAGEKAEEKGGVTRLPQPAEKDIAALEARTFKEGEKIKIRGVEGEHEVLGEVGVYGGRRVVQVRKVGHPVSERFVVGKRFIEPKAEGTPKPEAKDEGRDISAEKKAAVMQLRDVKSVVGGVFKKHGVDTSKINFGSFIEKRAGSATEEPSIWVDVPNKYVADIKSELDKRGHAHRTVELSGDRTRFMVNNKPDAPKEEAKTVDTTAPAGKSEPKYQLGYTIRLPHGGSTDVGLLRKDNGKYETHTDYRAPNQTHKPQVREHADKAAALKYMQDFINSIRKNAPENKITVYHSELK